MRRFHALFEPFLPQKAYETCVLSLAAALQTLKMLDHARGLRGCGDGASHGGVRGDPLQKIFCPGVQPAKGA
jgi:hypothetical protein